jgi:hypothetical protein
MLRSIVIGLVLTASFGAAAQTGQIPPPPSPRSSAPGSTSPSGQLPGTSMPQSSQSFGDRAIQCQHFAYTQGLPPGSVGSYTESCVNNR